MHDADPAARPSDKLAIHHRRVKRDRERFEGLNGCVSIRSNRYASSLVRRAKYCFVNYYVLYYEALSFAVRIV